jgi:hypothetical protein
MQPPDDGMRKKARSLLWVCWGLILLGGLGALGYGIYRVATTGVDELGIFLLFIGAGGVLGPLGVAMERLHS